jgi:hypothetical protein
VGGTGKPCPERSRTDRLPVWPRMNRANPGCTVKQVWRCHPSRVLPGREPGQFPRSRMRGNLLATKKLGRICWTARATKQSQFPLGLTGAGRLNCKGPAHASRRVRKNILASGWQPQAQLGDGRHARVARTCLSEEPSPRPAALRLPPGTPNSSWITGRELARTSRLGQLYSVEPRRPGLYNLPFYVGPI